MSREERYYHDLDSILEFPSVQMADAQLHQGKEWELIRIEKLTNDETDQEGIVKRSERLVFILGHRTSKQATLTSGPLSGSPTQPAAPHKILCKYCNAEIKWGKRDGRNIPLNPDGSDHRCRS